ncbi:MAG TPA: GNAT family N-acetyltransferase [Planctomycetota bacterium]|nr:GNAT family N-acetyltransferase [Planctomycetota bacterium]
MKIAHLFEHPEHLPDIARRIHEEWWADKSGHTVETMAARLTTTQQHDAVPLSPVALIGEIPVGTVNLVENDNDERRDLSPWLAALLVWPERRGLGIGSQLVRALVAEAARLGIGRI